MSERHRCSIAQPPGCRAGRRRWWSSWRSPLAGLPALLAGWSIVNWLLVAVVVFLVALPLWSRVVEGRRAAVDRLVTALVWVAFAVALVPAGLAAVGRAQQRAAGDQRATS